MPCIGQFNGSVGRLGSPGSNGVVLSKAVAGVSPDFVIIMSRVSYIQYLMLVLHYTTTHLGFLYYKTSWINYSE